MTKIPILCVVGPTASGKTALSVALAEHFSAEILSFDSMQLYQGMDIATAKPTPEEMHGIPHHMIDCVPAGETYSVARYKTDADRIIGEIHARGRQVVMVGGTGLYLDTVLKNITFLEDDGHEEIRRELKAELEREGPEAMYRKLLAADPEYAAKTAPANTKRVLRALEVYRATGYTMSYQIAQSRKQPELYAPTILGLNTRDRNVLYGRINRRVARMLQQGLLTEAREWQQNGGGETAAQAIGIKEMLPYLNGEATLESCTEKLKQATRHYAKRQLTWFRRNPAVHWLYLDDYSSEGELTADAVRTAELAGFPDGRAKERVDS